jgi:alpha-L-fucosidase 2
MKVNSIRPIAALLIALAICAAPRVSRAQTASPQKLAWSIDAAAVVSRSNIILERPNPKPSEAMPLGNGTLGVALWSADGFTAQLNRVDTLPRRLSPGQVVIPGLAALTAAKNYSGKLDLYNGTFQEQGGGMKLEAWVESATDTLVIDVSGAAPGSPQTALLKLWPPRAPHAVAAGNTGTLSESWIDNQEPGASGRSFGSLAAITATGRNVTATVTDEKTVALNFTPEADGHFQVRVAAPHYDGSQDIPSLAQRSLIAGDSKAHRLWWNGFWHRAGVIKVESSDGTGAYMENLRSIFLFASAAQSGGEYPGSQAGLADMFSSVGDIHRWDPAAFWHWNLRMQVAANLGAGLPELNKPYFNLYRENLDSITAWTKEHMSGRAGICVPETMRFNGPGIEYETWDMEQGGKATVALNCDATFRPYYNARTISTAAEVSFWIWQQYQATQDRAFLEKNYPVMAAAARFMLDYEKSGPDGLHHTSPTNAHETQWDITDSITDLLGRAALYQSTVEAATLLHKDPGLVSQLKSASKLIPPLPRTQAGKALTLLSQSADTAGQDVIASSYEPAAENHNVENLGLEPVWPFNVIGDDSPLTALARRTYLTRPYPINQDWSFDPIQAARLGLGTEVGSTLVQLTEKYQQFANGFANWGGSAGEFYIEQSGVVATALQEALVQDYDGVIRIAPAIPPGWNFDGSVWVRGKTKVSVHVRNGAPVEVIVESGIAQTLHIRNPWPGHTAEIVSSDEKGVKTSKRKGEAEITLEAAEGGTYALRSVEGPSLIFITITGEPASAPKKLGSVSIGISANTP